MEDKLLKEIAAYYSRTGNLGDTAMEFQISTQKCRKLLITAGVYESRSRTVNWSDCKDRWVYEAVCTNRSSLSKMHL